MEKIDSYINRRRIETWKQGSSFFSWIVVKLVKSLIESSWATQNTQNSSSKLFFPLCSLYLLYIPHMCYLSKFRRKNKTCCIYFMFSRLLLNASSVNMFIFVLLLWQIIIELVYLQNNFSEFGEYFSKTDFVNIHLNWTLQRYNFYAHENIPIAALCLWSSFYAIYFISVDLYVFN